MAGQAAIESLKRLSQPIHFASESFAIVHRGFRRSHKTCPGLDLVQRMR
jgi:hypothetical protein